MTNQRTSDLMKRGLAAVSTVLSLAAPAAAVDAKLESGSVCSFSDNSAFLSHAKRNGFRNDSGDTQTVVCPMVKEILGVNSTIAVDLLTSNGVNGNLCRVTTRPFGGGTVTVHAPDLVDFNGPTQFVHWNALSAPGGTAVEVECPVPDGEQIFSVEHVEA